MKVNFHVGPVSSYNTPTLKRVFIDQSGSVGVVIEVDFVKKVLWIVEDDMKIGDVACIEHPIRYLNEDESIVIRN